MCVRKGCQRRRWDQQPVQELPPPCRRLADERGRKRNGALPPIEVVIEQTQRCRELPARAEVPSWESTVGLGRVPCVLPTLLASKPLGSCAPQGPGPPNPPTRQPEHPQLQTRERVPHPATVPSGTPARRHLAHPTSSFPVASVSQMPPSCRAATGGAGPGGFPSPIKNNHRSDFREVQPRHRSYLRSKEVLG